MSHKPGHWLESKVNPGWWYGYGPGNPNPTNQPPPEPGMTPNITNQAEYNRNLNRSRNRRFNKSGNRNAAYKVYGTNEPYSGMTVEVGGYLYSTVGGALEGNSMQLIATAGSNSNVNTNQMSNINQNNNPVTRTFISRKTYYRQDGTPVPSGAELHQHQDGTIMLGHDPNNMGAIVTPTLQQSPDFNILTGEMTGAVPETVPPLPDGTCPVGYNLTPEGNCVHKSGNYGFRPTGGGSGNNNTNQGGGGSY